ncbi:GyrI-like domain-containing protein [Flagellimonas myxillae]|uniref:GyrI-like domain-containing protein n=1 Tax=Flagellimonas myxillae TaxID=2942214 RepID=UPI00201F9021|nr:GyrI-like domain-containing protein [Muricauda myxillae]MCL6267364.1 GyrI-like domain-containing protein [Muricauda myxillae]
MEPKIVEFPGKKLVGMHLTMSLANNRTFELWSKFKKKADQIKDRVSSDFISMQLYDTAYFASFNPAAIFEKWATVEVANHDNIPAEMYPFVLPKGLYAVFYYKGSSTDNSIFQHIFTEWLPNSGYQLDNRPHFEVLGSRYKNNDPNSEEEIWIPIQTNPTLK